MYRRQKETGAVSFYSIKNRRTHTYIYFRVNKAKKRINFSVNKAEYIIRTLYFNFAFKIANENSVCF